MDHSDHGAARQFSSGRAENHGRVFQQQSGVQINADSLYLANLAGDVGGSLIPAPLDASPVAETSATELGVHYAGSGTAGEIPPYVARQIDDELRARIGNIPRTGEMVLIVGDSTAGKTRAAYEALNECFQGHNVFAPYDGRELVASLPALMEARNSCVLWLDNLERYIGPDGLTPQILGVLRRSRVPVLSTIRAEQYRQLNPSHSILIENDERINLGRRLLEQVNPIVLPRLWNSDEIERARLIDDIRVQGAVAFSTHYGVAEYLAAGPRLYQEWTLAWGPGINPRGAALVAAAVDCVRAGITHSVTRELLENMHETYLARVGGAVLRPEPIEEAIDWATRLRFGVTSLLMPADQAGRYKVFDYIADEFMRASPNQPVPANSWRHVLEFAKSENSTYFVGVAAQSNGENKIAEAAWRDSAHRGSGKALIQLGFLYMSTDREVEAVEAWEKAARAGQETAHRLLGYHHLDNGRRESAIEAFLIGAEKDDVLSVRALASTLDEAPEAEHWWIKAVELADDVEDRHNLAYYYYSNGQKELARKYYKSAADEGFAPSMSNYGLIISEEAPDKAEELFRSAYEGGSLPAANNLARRLIDRGEIKEAEHLLKDALDRKHFKATGTLGYLYKKQGEVERAKAIWEVGVENDIEESIYNLALQLEREGDTSRAEELYRRIVESSVEAVENLGHLLVKSGDPDGAMELLGRAEHDLGPQNCCALGSAFYAADRRDVAKVWYQSALNAGHSHAGCWLGEIALHEGLHDEASQFYRSSFNGGHLHAAFRMSQMLLSLGKGKEASQWLRLSRGLPPLPVNRRVPPRKRRRKTK